MFVLLKGNIIKTNITHQESFETVAGIILEIKDTDTGQIANVLLEDESTVEVDYTATLTSPQKFSEKDKVILMKNQDNQYYILDFQRNNILVSIFIIFAIVLFLTSGISGLLALLAMVISFVIIFKIILPLIITGQNPVKIALIGSTLIIPVTFYISHGINKKTHIAVIATLITLVITSLLANYFTEISRLTGLADENYIYLSDEVKQFLDLKGLLLAGMIISILGILDDVTVAQSSIVEELYKNNTKIKFSELYKSAMKVGKDHISSMVNTLVLVYAGASLPLLLVFIDYSEKFMHVINYEFIATEIIQTLVGSIGLILAVPITTFLACKSYLYKSAK